MATIRVRARTAYINDAYSCFQFIGEYFRRAQKYSMEVEDGLKYLLKHDPNR